MGGDPFERAAARAGFVLARAYLISKAFRLPVLTSLRGRRFGRLIVVHKVNSVPSGACWLCRCNCGKRVRIAAMKLVSGQTRSCGCYRRWVQRGKRHPRFKHGHARHSRTSRTLNSFNNMLDRCRNPRSPKFVFYGGNNPPVRVCKRWRGPNGFQHFLEDMGARPPRTTLCRRADSGDYRRGNVYWGTRADQIHERNKKKCGSARS
jgi:hypothetical protein